MCFFGMKLLADMYDIEPKKIKQRPNRLILGPLETIILSLVILTGIVRVPNTLYRLSILRKENLQRLLFSKASHLNVMNLPVEIIQAILIQSDIRSTCRFAQSCTLLSKTYRQNSIWIPKLKHEWPHLKIEIRPSEWSESLLQDYHDSKFNAYELFRERWIFYRKTSISDSPLKKILMQEAEWSISFYLSLILLPFRLAGYCIFPLFWFLRNNDVRFSRSSSLSFLRCNLN
jgi:hypothetical protein